MIDVVPLRDHAGHDGESVEPEDSPLPGHRGLEITGDALGLAGVVPNLEERSEFGAENACLLHDCHRIRVDSHARPIVAQGSTPS